MKVKIFKITVWIACLSWMGMIFYFSSQPSGVSLQESGSILVQMNKIEKDDVDNISDSKVLKLQHNIRKSAHFILYSGLGFLAALSIALITYKSLITYSVAWLIAVLYSISDEVHQYFVPGRGPTFSDIKLDTVSALAGVVTAVVIIELWRRRRIKLTEAKVG